VERLSFKGDRKPSIKNSKSPDKYIGKSLPEDAKIGTEKSLRPLNESGDQSKNHSGKKGKEYSSNWG